MILPSEKLIHEKCLSKDYKERVIGEYWYIREKYERLHALIIKREAGKLDFDTKTPLDSWINQAAAQLAYLHELELKSQYEEIDLDSILYPQEEKKTEEDWNLE